MIGSLDREGYTTSAISRWSAPTAYCFANVFTNAQEGPAVGPFARNASIVDRLCREHGKIYCDTSLSCISFCDELPPDDAAETDAGLCSVFHDHLAWREQAYAVKPSLLPFATEAALVPALLLTSTATFAVAVGHRVQLIANAPAASTYSGQHKERHLAAGVQRINFHRLDNSCSDCYREHELQAAWIRFFHTPR